MPDDRSSAAPSSDRLSLSLARTRSSHFPEPGFAYSGLAGVNVGFSPHVGMFVAGGYTRPSSPENVVGERLEMGGFSVVNGLRVNGVTGWW